LTIIPGLKSSQNTIGPAQKKRDFWRNRKTRYEIDKTAAECAKAFGANVYFRDVLAEKHADDGKKFSLILISQVVEHILNPHQLMEAVTAKIYPGAAVYIDVPNPAGLVPMLKRFNVLKKKYADEYLFIQPPWHYVAYYQQSLRFLLNSHNLTVCHLSCPGNSHPIFGQLSEYSCLQRIVNGMNSRFNVGSMLTVIATSDHSGSDVKRACN
jgi:hypothetical protein